MELEAVKALLQLHDLLRGIPAYQPKNLAATDIDILLQRYKTLRPQQRVLLLKAARSEPGVKHCSLPGVFKVKAAADGGPKMLAGVASSTNLDLDSERFATTALEDMTAIRGSSAMLAHSYKVPEDILGVITDATVGKIRNGSALNVTIKIAESNPRAVGVWQLVAEGVRIGLSVGVIVLQSNPIDLPDGRRATEIVRCLPIEISAVAIPANFDDAWITSAKSRR